MDKPDMQRVWTIPSCRDLAGNRETANNVRTGVRRNRNQDGMIRQKTRARVLGALVVVLGCAVSASGQETAPGAPGGMDAQTANTAGYKVRVVDRKRVFDEHRATQRKLDALAKERDEKQAEIDKLSAAVQTKKDQFEEQKDSMTDEQRTALEEEIRTLFQEYRDQFDRLQREINEGHRKIIAQGQREIDEAVHTLGEEEDCHLVLEGDPKANGGVLYYSKTIDMTSKVIAFLNSKDTQSSDEN